MGVRYPIDLAAGRKVVRINPRHGGEAIYATRRRAVILTGRVLDAREAPAFWAFPGCLQHDILIDYDWRFWHLQFMPLMRPECSISYAYRAQLETCAAADARDRISYAMIPSNPLGRRLVLCHVVFPASLAEYIELPAIGSRIRLDAYMVNLSGSAGSETCPYAPEIGIVHQGQRGPQTECPWLVLRGLWPHLERAGQIHKDAPQELPGAALAA